MKKWETLAKTKAVVVRNDAFHPENKVSNREDEDCVTRQLLIEHRLRIEIAGKLFSTLICTPSDLENLVLGHLITERVIKTAEDVEQILISANGEAANVFLKPMVEFEETQKEEGTPCEGNRPLLQSQNAEGENGDGERHSLCLQPEQIFSLVKKFAEDSLLHKSTGGTHSSLLAAEDRILYQAEDIGRHNALDKAIGYAVRERLDRDRCILFTTGRVPTDMVQKAVAAGIPVLVSKSVPTMDAVELAQKCGLTLICRAWQDSYEVYAQSKTS